jgi:hypothetical protein
MSLIRRAVWTTVLATLVANPALAERAAQAEFGLGPRVSESRVYTATLQPAQQLRLRHMQTVPVLVVDADGRPVDDATITVDGGMPEHSHGLPTQPLVRRSLGGGVYEIEGVRFSMGGWWELKLSIESPRGRDRITFNLAL